MPFLLRNTVHIGVLFCFILNVTGERIYATTHEESSSSWIPMHELHKRRTNSKAGWKSAETRPLKPDALSSASPAQATPGDPNEHNVSDDPCSVDPIAVLPHANYREQEAIRFTDLARVAFSNESGIVNWTCGDMCDRTRELLSSDSEVRFIKPGKTWQVQGYIAKLADGECVLAFRGSLHPMNWLADAKAISKEWPPPDRDGSWCPKCRVHWGFADAYEELRPQMNTELADLKCDRVKITGHSLGGAMAPLAAAELRAHNWPEVTTVYTFGSPRVGNQAFVEAFTDVSTRSGYIPPQWRIVHNNDPVVYIAPRRFPFRWLKYAHSGKAVWYDKNFVEYHIAADSPRPSAIGFDDEDDVYQAPPWKWINLDHVNYFNRSFRLKIMRSGSS
jgi:hypothetical protein